jgi:hypothetical protein
VTIFLSSLLRRFSSGYRERGWTEISAADYAETWQRHGGSVATHPAFVERLSRLADIPVRYLGWSRENTHIAAIPVWGRHLALSRAALKSLGKKGCFDLGNAEVILPVAETTAETATKVAEIPLRHAGRYLSNRHASAFTGLLRQQETLAVLKQTERLSAKFRYNQRRELRLFMDAGGVIRPVRDFTPAELAGFYTDLFRQRWGFPATGAARMAETFTLLRDWMTGSVLFLRDAPVAVQVLYRVESPRWVSVEFVNGGVDPQSRDFSPGSVLTWLNTETERETARTLGKSLRYSFGRADRDYKTRWCVAEQVLQSP